MNQLKLNKKMKIKIVIIQMENKYIMNMAIINIIIIIMKKIIT